MTPSNAPLASEQLACELHRPPAGDRPHHRTTDEKIIAGRVPEHAEVLAVRDAGALVGDGVNIAREDVAGAIRHRNL